MCTQVQHRQLPSTDHFVASNRWPQATNKQHLTLSWTGDSQEASEPTYPMASFRTQQSTIWLAPQMALPKGGKQAPDPEGANPALWGKPPHSSSYAVVMANTASQPEGQTYPLMCQWQSRLSYKRMAHTTHTRDFPEEPSSGDHRVCATGQNSAPNT